MNYPLLFAFLLSILISTGSTQNKEGILNLFRFSEKITDKWFSITYSNQAFLRKTVKNKYVSSYKPHYRENYYPKLNDNLVFTYLTKSYFTYDKYLNIIEEIIKTPTTHENLARKRYTYDNYGNQTEFLHEGWKNGIWEITKGTKYEYTYNNSTEVVQIE